MDSSKKEQQQHPQKPPLGLSPWPQCQILSFSPSPSNQNTKPSPRVQRPAGLCATPASLGYLLSFGFSHRFRGASHQTRAQGACPASSTTATASSATSGGKTGFPPQVFSRHTMGLRLSPHLQNLRTDSTLKCFLPGGRAWGAQGCRAGCHSPSQLCGEHHTSRGQESRDAGSGTTDVQKLLLLLLKHLP